jgi:hypothetical protein
VERQLPLNSVLSVAYVAHGGLHAWQVYDINQPTVGAASSAGGNERQLSAPLQGLRCDSGRGEHGQLHLQLPASTVESPFLKGGMFGFSYTLSKSEDNGSNFRDIVPYTYNTSNLWGPAEYDARHIVIVNYAYDVPFFKNNRAHTRQDAGRMGDQRRFAIPDRHSVRHRNQRRLRWSRRIWQLRLRLRGQFWVLNGTPTISAGAFGGPVTTSRSPRQAPSTCSMACVIPFISLACGIGPSAC